VATSPPKRKLNPLVYERRLTLFIDFLGFKEHVQDTVSDPSVLRRLVSAMDRVGEIARDDRAFNKSQQITQFSDCIVVSYRVEEESAVFWLLNEIAFCVIDLVELGFLLRGALTVGCLLHTAKHLVGPALVDAYELESKVAKFPRILIEEKVLDVAKRAHREGHTKREEEDYVKTFMTKDTDGRYYFDYVSWTSVVATTGGDNNGYPAYLQKVGDIIRSGLRHSNPKVLEKYLWLHQQYVAAIQMFEQLPPGNAYRQENPTVCNEIEDLPRLTEIALVAQQSVDAARQG
jgi:hypothetical protein